MSRDSLRWVILPGLAETPEEFGGVRSLLVLVDTSLPSEDGWPPFHPGRAGDRFVRSALAFLGSTGLPRLIGPFLRDRVFKASTLKGWDPLIRATIRRRYGARSSWVRFWDELAASWPLAEQVAALVDARAQRDSSPPTIQLVAGASRFGQERRRWLRRQHELSRRLGSGVVVLPDAAHLVHLDRPDAIAAAMTGGVTRPLAG